MHFQGIQGKKNVFILYKSAYNDNIITQLAKSSQIKWVSLKFAVF